MEDSLENITETPRTGINNDSRPEEDQNVTEPPHSPKQDTIPIQEDHRARFYESYRKVAGEYDKGFLKKHDDDLTTTLIFAGLFSAVTSAFAIQLDSQLQPDPNEETAALLRVILYKIDNSTFGKNIPALQQWSGPPRAIVQVQTLLFASLIVSLFSAFLAMLGKQWLNRYESIDIRGSAVERSHDRQRKLNGIIVWYFNHVMESLPLMLQAGLLLLGCALSRYLWEVNTIVASVVLSVTSFGVFFYLFILIAGTVSESCPYQTPGAHLFRRILHHLRHRLHHLRHHLLPALYSTLAATPTVVSSNFSRIFQASYYYSLPSAWSENMETPWYSISNFGFALIYLFIILFAAPVHDAFFIGRAIFRSLVAFTREFYYRLIDTLGAAYSSFLHTSLPMPNLDHETILLDLRCISWILRTSLDKVVHLSAFKHLTSIPDLAHFHPPIVIDCFKIFVGCINITNSRVVIREGLEPLATEAANGFLSTLHHLASIDPTSGALVDLQRRYNEIFSSEIDFTGLSFHSTMSKIHALASRFGSPRDIQWPNRRLSVKEYIPFARRMAEAAQEKYRLTPDTQDKKVPRRILRSALYFLTLGPLAPASVIADCLTVVAIDLECDVSNVEMSDESARVDGISSLIIEKLESMAEHSGKLYSYLIFLKRKAINTLLPYAIFLEQGGHQGMIVAISRAARVSDSDLKTHGKFMWPRVVQYISRLYEKQSPTSLNRAITLISPYVPWEGALNNPVAVARWAAAASTAPYSDEVGKSMVVTLYQIAFISFLRPHIPINTWRMLKTQPPLSIEGHGVREGCSRRVVTYIRALGDIDLLKSHFLLVWTEDWVPSLGNTHIMKASIREHFSGVEMAQQRKDLINHLDNLLTAMYRMNPNPLEKRRRCAEMRDVLLELDRQ